MRLAKAQEEMKTQYLLPERIVLQADAQNAVQLLAEQPRQAFLGEFSVCTLQKGGYVLLDFGCEFQGGADIVIQRTEHKEDALRLVFGESVSEAMSSIGVHNAVNDHAPRDMTVSTEFLSHLCLGNTGYRFLKLEAVSGEIAVSSVQGVSRFRDLSRIGSFRCSDDLLNEIWQVGVRTVHLNMQEYLWDGIKRDRLVWVGDMHPETATISMAFGETDVVKKSLDFVRDHTPADSFMNNHASYSMWWIRIQRDLYWDFGNFDYLKEQEPYLVSVLEHTLSHIDADDICDIDDHFVEWSVRGKPDETDAFYAMLIVGLAAGAELLELLHVSAALAERCRTAVRQIKTRRHGSICNKQTAAMLGLSGLGDLQQLCAQVIKPGGAEGISAFWGYYVLLALQRAGETEFALELIRRYWGAMLDLGATTFWEEFDIAWTENACRIDEPCRAGKMDPHGGYGSCCYTGLRKSLCHGWASGPTSFLSRCVLGVQAVQPGYQKIKVVPDLGGLSYAEGEIPTPFGTIFVKHTLKDGAVQTELSVPDGIEII